MRAQNRLAAPGRRAGGAAGLTGTGYWVPELIDLAGGVPLFGKTARRAPRLTWPELLAADPDVVIAVPAGDSPAGRREIAGFLEVAAGRGLRALRESRLYLLDAEPLLLRAGPRLLQGLEALAEAIHPEAFRLGQEGSALQPVRP